MTSKQVGLIKPFRQRNTGKQPPAELKTVFELYQCDKCDKFAQIPRTPMLSLALKSTPNVAISLGAATHQLRNSPPDILVTLDFIDVMLCPALVCDCLASTAFLAYFSEWVAYFC